MQYRDLIYKFCLSDRRKKFDKSILDPRVTFLNREITSGKTRFFTDFIISVFTVILELSNFCGLLENL